MLIVILTHKKTIAAVLSVLLILAIGIFLTFNLVKEKKLVRPIGKEVPTPTEKPLGKYSFENLKKRQFAPGTITFDEIVKDDPEFASYLFYFTSDGKKVSGLANLPKREGKFPVIVQFRGYINPNSYEIGAGSVHSGQVFAKNGFITLAPDFLGYGKSASASAEAIEARFETYTTALNLLAGLKNLNQALSNGIPDQVRDDKGVVRDDIKIEADTNKVGIWGHSNGGHIALSILEITGKPYPTVLWNPVSKSFPYSILYYSDEPEDHGKALRKLVADFEKDYEADNYSLSNYFDWIKAPIQLHQAEEDEAVPRKWSDGLYEKLKSLDKEIIYYTYPRNDHDFHQGSWDMVVERNMAFYREYFSKD